MLKPEIKYRFIPIISAKILQSTNTTITTKSMHCQLSIDWPGLFEEHLELSGKSVYLRSLGFHS